ncbi:MCE family protein [Legionella israelensis]|uniref:MCE family protein n=1 Tax=Legionella israelensis TaxID=454 RepID=A0AAX1EES9_9GAMM|nr:MlaD family protein [Legionella israelensis]QBR83584.1 MCE family protein [Legionella israelensis]
MESKANYTLVGLIVLILTAALLATALWLSVGFDKKKYNTYVVCLQEAASGLSEDSEVSYNGVKVGYVKKIDLDRTDPQQVVLLLAIEEGTPITTTTYATLISKGITGVTYVGLSADDSDLTPLKRQPGQPYPIIPSKPSLFTQLDKVLKNVSENINKVSIEIQRVFDRENAESMKKTLTHVEKFSNILAQNSENIDQIISRTDVVMKNMANISNDLPELVKNLKVAIHQINGMASDVSEAGKSVSSTMKAGKLTIDQISQSTVPSAVSLLRRLDNIAANLEIVSVQMRQNPAIILRGTTTPKPGPGEK